MGNLSTRGHRHSASTSARESERPVELTLQSLLSRANSLNVGLNQGYGGMTYENLKYLAQTTHIPAYLYRSHVGNKEDVERYGLRRSVGSSINPDNYIRDIIMHSSRLGGSAGAVLSLTSNLHVANRFRRPGNVVAMISTSLDYSAFKSIAQVIYENADTLLKNGRIQQATILSALRHITAQNENEFFYMRGDIPPQFIIKINT